MHYSEWHRIVLCIIIARKWNCWKYQGAETVNFELSGELYAANTEKKHCVDMFTVSTFPSTTVYTYQEANSLNCTSNLSEIEVGFNSSTANFSPIKTIKEARVKLLPNFQWLLQNLNETLVITRRRIQKRSHPQRKVFHFGPFPNQANVKCTESMKSQQYSGARRLPIYRRNKSTHLYKPANG